MTTVAFDGNTLAADSQITSDWKSIGHSKFYRFHDGAIGAFAGTWSRVLEAQRFLDGLSDDCPTEDWTAIIMRPEGTAEFRDADGCRMDITAKHYAIGSGAHFALAAMECGKTAAEAVEIASHLDQHTGGPVEFVRIDEVLPVPKRKTTRRKTAKR